MGSFISSAMDDNMKKQQVFMVENQVTMLERNMNMQNAMRERMMATQIARTRELLNWSGSFAAIVGTLLTVGAIKSHKPQLLAPLLPLGYVVGYQYDLAYNGKMTRITNEAEKILNNEQDLLNIALGMPDLKELDNRRANVKNSAGSGNWWDGWIQAAKDKSAQTLELIKNDLSEFSTVCTQDASTLVTTTTDKLHNSLQPTGEQSNTERVKAGFTNFLGGISKALTIPPDDDDQADILRVTPGGTLEVFDKAKARLYEIQISPQTYCTEPDGSIDSFDEWRSTFDLDSKKGEISELLVSVNELRSIYTKLVPSAVTHQDFWERYFYKVHQLEEDEKRKANLKNRADKLKQDDSEQAWEDDWETEDTDTPDVGGAADIPSPSPILPDIGASITAPTPDAEAESQNIPSTAKVNTSTTEVTTPTEQTEDNVTHIEESSSLPDDKNENIGESASSSTLTDSVDNKNVVSPHELDTLVDEILTVTDDKPVFQAEEMQEEQLSNHEEESSVTDDKTEELSPVENLQQTSGDSADNKTDDIPVKEKGGYVMLGSERPTPTSSIGSSNAKESSSGLDDEWDKELFGDDMKAVEELAQKIQDGKEDVNLDDDWESWE